MCEFGGYDSFHNRPPSSPPSRWTPTSDGGTPHLVRVSAGARGQYQGHLPQEGLAGTSGSPQGCGSEWGLGLESYPCCAFAVYQALLRVPQPHLGPRGGMAVTHSHSHSPRGAMAREDPASEGLARLAPGW